MKDYTELYESKKITVDEVLGKIKSGDNIYVGVDIAEPIPVLERIHEIADEVTDVCVHSVLGPSDYKFLHDPRGNIKLNPFFYGPYCRGAHDEGNVSLVPANISTLFRDRNSVKPANIFIGVASPMDKHGYFNMGLCISHEMEALYKADIVILEVNPNVPVVYGDAFVHIKNVDYVFETTREMPLDPVYEANEIQTTIGNYIADLIEDGSTIQLGIGGIPDTAAKQLMNKNDLGVHSEMFTPSMIDLYEAGVITGRKKNIDKYRMVCTLLVSRPEVFEFVDHNPAVHIGRGTYVNDPYVIMQNDKMVSINTAIDVDITGQVYSESIRGRQFSGTGGANDFAVGAHRSKGGKSIIAIPSTKKKGTISSIEPIIVGVVTIQRQTVDYVVTEYGVAHLTGASVAERIEALINIAHPKFRDELRDEAKRLKLW